MDDPFDGLVGLEGFQVDFARMLLDDFVALLKCRVASIDQNLKLRCTFRTTYTVIKLMSNADERLRSPNILGGPISSCVSTWGSIIGAAVMAIILAVGRREVARSANMIDVVTLVLVPPKREFRSPRSYTIPNRHTAFGRHLARRQRRSTKTASISKSCL